MLMSFEGYDQTNSTVKWFTVSEPTGKGVSGKVQLWLYEQPPCAIVKLSDVYGIDENRDAVRAAIYRYTANTPVFSNNKTRIAYEP